MYERGCVVTATVNGEERSLSGILLDSRNGLVLTHGSLLTSLLSERQIHYLSTQGKLSHCFRSWQAEVLFQNVDKISSTSVASNLNNADIENTLHTTCSNTEFKQNNVFSKFSASVVIIFVIRRLQNVLTKLVSPNEKWEFIDENSPEGISEDQKKMQKLLPSFVLIKIDDWKGFISPLRILNYSQYSKGDNLMVEATPFANLNPDIFMNHKSTGIVSNKAGGILIMTDARCVPGTDGGAVFIKKGHLRYLIGVVITSLCWRNNEWVGLSLVCAIPDILKTVEQICKIDRFYESQVMKIHRNRLSEIFEAVPMVMVGSNWGSGVVIGHKYDRYVLTCSHVIKGSDYTTVKVKFPTERVDIGKVLYKTATDGQFDTGIISISSKSVPYVEIATNPVSEGDRVFVIGHPLFSEEKRLDPTITSGIISKVVKVNGIPVLVQTTCAVHAGASGGALVNQSGELVGIPVSNAKDMSSKALFPHINMSVPVTTIAHYLLQFMETKDVNVLEKLSVTNPDIKRLWMLEQIKGASRL